MEKVLKGVCILFFGIALFYNAVAVEVTGWTQCVQRAKDNNPDFKAAITELKQAKEDLTTAYSSWYPQADLDFSVRTGWEGSETYSTGISVRQLIFDGFKTPATIGKAQAQFKKAKSSFAITSASLRYQLREAYTELLKSGKLLQLTEVIVKRRKQNVDLVKLRYAAGREHAGSRLTAEADLAQAKFEVEQARRNFELAEQKLAKLIGIPDEPVSVTGFFDISQNINEVPDFPVLVLNAPEVKELMASEEASRHALQVANAQHYPTIYASFSAGLDDDHFFPEASSISGGISLSLPLFEGWSATAAIIKARYDLEQVKYNLQSQKNTVKYNLEQKWKNLQDASGYINVQKMYLQAAQARAKIANARYSSGLVSFDDWTIIEDRLVSMQKSYLNSQAELLLAEAQWVQSKGEGLEHE